MKKKDEVRGEATKSRNLVNRLKEEERGDWLDLNDSHSLRHSPRRFFPPSSDQTEVTRLQSPIDFTRK